MGRKGTQVIYQDRLVPYTKEERKAPTDESIRLLNEFRNETIEELLKGVKIQSTVLQDVNAYVMSPHVLGRMVYEWVVKFKINDEDYTVKGAVEPAAYAGNITQGQSYRNIGVIVNDMCKKISDTIALIIGKEIIKSFENLEL